jgi:hypothetical protein
VTRAWLSILIASGLVAFAPLTPARASVHRSPATVAQPRPAGLLAIDVDVDTSERLKDCAPHDCGKFPWWIVVFVFVPTAAVVVYSKATASRAGAERPPADSSPTTPT